MEDSIIELSDGREVTVRLLTLEDRDELLEFFSNLSDSALRWGMPPYTEARIDHWIDSLEHLIPLVAVDDSKIVGYSAVHKYSHPRLKGTAEMGIYIHQEFHNLGLGTAMTRKSISLAEEDKLHRLSLQVVEDNVAAIALYKKMGFRVEGNLEDAYFGSDQEFHNLLVMGKLL